MSEIIIDSDVLQQLIKQASTKENKKEEKVLINYMEMEEQDYIIC